MTNITLTPEQIAFLDECTKGTWNVKTEGLVDIEGYFYGDAIVVIPISPFV